MSFPSALSKLLIGTLTVLAAVVVVARGGELSSSDLELGAELPHPAEIQLMEELAAWSGETPTATAARPFPETSSLASSVQRYPESFSLFRQVAGQHGRAATLATLPFGQQIEHASARHRVDALLIAAIVSAESDFDPRAISPVGAQGLMQLMPETARYLGGDEAAGVQDPVRNLELGALYVKRLMKLYGGDVALTLAAYNSGPGNVRKFGGIPPFTETRRYVEKVLERYIDLQQAALAADRFHQADTGAELAAGS